MALKVIAHMPGCEGGNCATIWEDTATGRVRVRGTHQRRSWRLWRTREADVEMSAEDWAHLVAQLPR